MLKRSKAPSAFTLLELMVVILVIAILAGLAFPVFQGVLERARKLQAKNDLTQIVTAVNAFYTEYGKYPGVTTDITITNNSDLFYTLRAIGLGTWNNNDAANPRKIVFISPPSVKSDTLGNRRGGVSPSDGNYYDPWGMSYRVTMDGDYDNQINPNPYGNNNGAGPSPLPQGAIAWSLGKDKTPGKAGNGIFTGSDDVISWQ